MTEGRTNGAVFEDFNFNRQGTTAEQNCQAFCIFNGARTGNLRTTTGNCFLYYGSSKHFTVKYDSNLFTDVFSSQISKFICASGVKFQTNNCLVALRDLRTSIFQITTGQNNITAFILEVQHCSTTEHCDCFFRVFYARKFNDNAVFALTLNNGFGQTKFVYTTFNNSNTAVYSVFIYFHFRSIHCLQNNVGTTLQVQTLFNRVGQRLDINAEAPDNCQCNNQEFP